MLLRRVSSSAMGGEKLSNDFGDLQDEVHIRFHVDSGITADWTTSTVEYVDWGNLSQLI
jgi:hypothetical protein